MSALGQKQTFAVQKRMSALPPIADMYGAKRDVRFVPIADIGDQHRPFMLARALWSSGLPCDGEARQPRLELRMKRRSRFCIGRAFIG